MIPDPFDDEAAAAGDDLRDLADLDPKGPRPREEDLC